MFSYKLKSLKFILWNFLLKYQVSFIILLLKIEYKYCLIIINNLILLILLYLIKIFKNYLFKILINISLEIISINFILKVFVYFNKITLCISITILKYLQI